MKLNKKGVLGIIVCYVKSKKPPFLEESFFNQLTKTGIELNMNVIIFNPKDVDWNTFTVPGWNIGENGKWQFNTHTVPTLIYDRCYYMNSQQYMEYKPSIIKIAQHTNIRLLGYALGGKWQTYEILEKDPQINSYLPLTIRYQTTENFFEFLNKHSSAIIKPNGGSHGRGVVAITKQDSQFQLQGRTLSNSPFQIIINNQDQLDYWLKNFVKETRYIIQSFLELRTYDHRPFDLRILIQKNIKREWEITGKAVRTGDPYTITSNLHGGGKAISFDSFIKENYSEEIIPLINEDIQKLSLIVPLHIEENHGPLVELGLDLGIDTRGKVWIIEVNSKPGRTIFLQTGEKEIRKRAIQLPMLYAYALLMGN